MAEDKLAILRILMRGEGISENLPHGKEIVQASIVLDEEETPLVTVAMDKEKATLPLDMQDELNENAVSAQNGHAVGKHCPDPRPWSEGRTPISLPKVADHDIERRAVGDSAPVGIKFCPILAVAKYPYKYMHESHDMSEKVSWKYFASDKFWSRTWTVYFIYPPPSVSVKPLLLVPATEAESLLTEINEDFELQLTFPTRRDERGFLLEFPEDGQPRPHFLGTSSSRGMFKDMENQVPVERLLVKGTESLAIAGEDRSYASFKLKMDMAIVATQKKTKAYREKKKLHRVQQKDALCRQLRRTQRYLGLRPRSGTGPSPSASEQLYQNPDQSWEDFVRTKEQYDKSNSASPGELPIIDVELPVPYLFDYNVVFVCVDVESYERNHSVITEIGISTLDTNDLEGIAPGELGKQWMPKICSRHFRVKEYQHLVNKDFIVGCPDRFERSFGVSEFISIKDAPQVVASCFRLSVSGFVETTTSIEQSRSKRKIILVGHDTKNDIKYLRDLGYDPGNLSNLLEVLDTAEVYRAMKMENQPTSLGNLLCNLGLTGWNLHNAGNDAAYTLQALIAIAFKALAPKEDRLGKGLEQRSAEAKMEAAKQVAEEAEEWTIAEGNNDGGSPELKIDNSKADAPNEMSRGGYGGGRGGRGSTGSGGRGRAGKNRGAYSDGQGRAGPALLPRGDSMSRHQEKRAQAYTVEKLENEAIIARHSSTLW